MQPSGKYRYQGQHAGHFCLDDNNCLLRFQLLTDYQARAEEIFRSIIAIHKIQQAITSTIEPLYSSLCLDFQRHIEVHSYLFRDNTQAEGTFALGIFREAEKNDLEDLTHFYYSNTEGPGEWITTFLQERLEHKELFILYHQQEIVATGECIPNPQQPPYADLGMVVAQAYRGRSLGSAMLIRLKKLCYEAGWKPICSCATNNLTSKKAIEKAGFISEQRMVKVQF